eukprot:3990297-Alexandrium_andersonii.AAC.1
MRATRRKDRCCTFTASCLPPSSVARCTCARLAEATGSQSKVSKMSAGRRSKSSHAEVLRVRGSAGRLSGGTG